MAKGGGSMAIKIGLWVVGLYIAYVVYKNWTASAATSSRSSTQQQTSVGAGAPTNSLVPNSGNSVLTGTSTLTNGIQPGSSARPLFGTGGVVTGFNNGYRNGGAWGIATPIVRFSGLTGTGF